MPHSYKTSYLRDPIQQTMAQDAREQAARKRNATKKLERRRAVAEVLAGNAPVEKAPASA